MENYFGPPTIQLYVIILIFHINLKKFKQYKHVIKLLIFSFHLLFEKHIVCYFINNFNGTENFRLMRKFIYMMSMMRTFNPTMIKLKFIKLKRLELK